MALALRPLGSRMRAKPPQGTLTAPFPLALLLSDSSLPSLFAKTKVSSLISHTPFTALFTWQQ